MTNPVDALTQNIRMQILQQAKDHIKQDYKEKLIGLPCKKCNLPESTVKDFSDGDNSVIAHLECTNCGFKDELVINLITEGLEEDLNSVKTGLNDLQKEIDNTNRRINR